MQTYTHYKDSGIDWIGTIPEHWEVKRLKNILSSKLKYGANESGYEYDSNLSRYIRISDFGYDGKLNESKKLSLPDNIAKDYLLKDGDILFARSGATVGKAYQFKTSLGTEKSYCYAGYLIKAEPDINHIQSDFLNFYTQSGAFMNWKDSIFNKATIENIGADKYSELLVPIPPIQEQEAIANFLDEKTAKIDALVHTKEQQIEKLKELRQAKIHQAVTKGLDASAPIKDSGVDWIGEIPENWGVKRLKNFSSVVLGKMLCNEDKGNYDYKPYLKSKNIQWLNVNIDSVENMWFSKYEQDIFRLKKGDLILSEGGEVGKVCIWNDELAECYIQNSAHKVTVNSNNSSKYHLYNLFTAGKLGLFDSIVNKVSIGHLTREKLINIFLPIPPIQEQEQIVAYLDEVTGKIDQAIAQKQEQITKLKEYKQSLINDVVTGKIKVC